jgi:hypothetical protein
VGESCGGTAVFTWMHCILCCLVVDCVMRAPGCVGFQFIVGITVVLDGIYDTHVLISNTQRTMVCTNVTVYVRRMSKMRYSYKN